MSFIEVKNVSKTFKISKRRSGVPGMLANLFVPKYEKKEAVKNIGFNIEKGEMVGFIEPNGAGKSTTIKMLSGILYPDSGEINVGGYIPLQAAQKLRWQDRRCFRAEVPASMEPARYRQL